MVVKMKNIILFWTFIVMVSGFGIGMVDQTNPTTMELDESKRRNEPVISCWESLNCSIEQIQAMKIKDRLEFMWYMSESKLPLLAATNEFRAVEGTMDFFVRMGIANQGTWMSYINAAVLEAIQRGTAISLGQLRDTGANPAAILWANFLNQKKSGGLVDRDTHDRAWAIAEQTAVDYGIRVADSKPNIRPPTLREQRWQYFTRIYRVVMQYRRTLLWLIQAAFAFTNPSLPMVSQAFMDWFTDVTDATSTGFLAEISWRFCAIGLSRNGENPAEDERLILAVVTECWEAFQMKQRQ